MKTLVAIILGISLLAGAGLIMPNHATAMGKKAKTICPCGSKSKCTCGKGMKCTCPSNANKANNKMMEAKCACGSGKLASKCCAKPK